MSISEIRNWKEAPRSLFLDLGLGDPSVFTLRKFVNLYTCNWRVCIYVYLDESEKKCQNQVTAMVGFEEVRNVFTSLWNLKVGRCSQYVAGKVNGMSPTAVNKALWTVLFGLQEPKNPKEDHGNGQFPRVLSNSFWPQDRLRTRQNWEAAKISDSSLIIVWGLCLPAGLFPESVRVTLPSSRCHHFQLCPKS